MTLILDDTACPDIQPVVIRQRARYCPGGSRPTGDQSCRLIQYTNVSAQVYGEVPFDADYLCRIDHKRGTRVLLPRRRLWAA